MHIDHVHLDNAESWKLIQDASPGSNPVCSTLTTGATWWLHLSELSDTQATMICTAFGLPYSLRDDLTSSRHLEKFRDLGHCFMFSVTTCLNLHQDYEQKTLTRICAVVFGDGIITVGQHALATAAHRQLSQIHLEGTENILALRICHVMFNEVVRSFLPPSRRLREKIDSVAISASLDLYDGSSTVAEDIDDCRAQAKVLFDRLRGILAPLYQMIHGLRTKQSSEHAFALLRTEADVYFSNVLSRTTDILADLQHCQAILYHAQSLRSSHLKCALVRKNARTNRLLVRATMLTALVMMLQLIPGLMSMYVIVPGQDTEGLAWFFGILGLMLLILFCFVLCMRRSWSRQ